MSICSKLTAARRAAPLVITLTLMASLLPTAASAQAGLNVDLRVLVVSSGDRYEDAALPLMQRTLDNLGVPYDVLDSRRTDLTSAQLYNSVTSGKYNGIILTVSDLYQPSGGSGFTAAEWTLLRDYERTFLVRESIVSGFPLYDASLGLDYGMATVGSLAAGSGTWVAPAGGTDLFEYVNTTNPLDMPGGFAWTGVPRTGDPSAPTVTPLLVNPADNSFLISKLNYADGREVLLSTIANAWYFVHSYALAYEFVNFATKGVFIGSRQTYLSVHTDDLFIEDGIWDPANNVVSAIDYRMTPADVTRTIANQNAFKAAHPLASGYRTTFQFNGYGAGNGTRIIPNETYTPLADAQVRAQTCPIGLPCSSTATKNYGADTVGAIDRTLEDNSRLLLRFDGQLALGAPNITAVTLRLTSSGLNLSSRPSRVCRVTEDWTEGVGKDSTDDTTNVSWQRRTGTTDWASAGGSYDAANCVTFNLKYTGTTSVNILPIFDQWAAGQPDYGVVVMATGNSVAPISVNTREATTGRPSLVLTFPTTPVDALTTAIVANKSQFTFSNHTYASRQMDRICPEEPNPQPVLCDVTNLLTATNEIARNRTVWRKLGLPDFAEGSTFLLTDSHAGVFDRRSTEENPDDDIPYPAGKNNNLFQAMVNLGVKYIATDSSRPGQDAEAFAPDYNVFTSPRYPSAIWVNSTTPDENTDQYNWIFHDRFVAMGQDPCQNLAAICTTRSWQQILDSEAELTTLHMLSGSMWPHYMHQSNLRAYDGVNQLQFDWLNAVMTRYERNIKLPVLTLKPWQIGAIEQRLSVAKTRNVRGNLDIATGRVTLVANGAAQPTVTGLAGGTTYGGQRQLVASVSATPTVFTVDRALGV